MDQRLNPTRRWILLRGVLVAALVGGACTSLPEVESGVPLREQLVITPRTPDVPLDGSTQIRVEAVDQFYAIKLPIVWTSDDPTVISVQGTGRDAVLRAFRTGFVVITATDASGATGTVRARSRGGV